jgi:two-component system OmpR family response regulator
VIASPEDDYSRWVLRTAARLLDRSYIDGQETANMTFRAYIVEDSPTIRENLIETLEELAEVEAVGTAETETEGKRWLAANDSRWDLAIVDLFLKEGSGLNVVAACRARRPTQKLVVLSNHATNDIRWRCAELGADAVFDKSTEIEKLVEFCVNVQEG